MKIMPVSYSTNTNLKTHKVRRCEQPQNPTFNGGVGKAAGLILGEAAAVGLSFFAAPVLICAGPALALAGMLTGDKIEDKVKNKPEIPKEDFNDSSNKNI